VAERSSAPLPPVGCMRGLGIIRRAEPRGRASPARHSPLARRHQSPQVYMPPRSWPLPAKAHWCQGWQLPGQGAPAAGPRRRRQRQRPAVRAPESPALARYRVRRPDRRDRRCPKAQTRREEKLGAARAPAQGSARLRGLRDARAGTAGSPPDEDNDWRISCGRSSNRPHNPNLPLLGPPGDRRRAEFWPAPGLSAACAG
jgi:hypothetical protein